VCILYIVLAKVFVLQWSMGTFTVSVKNVYVQMKSWDSVVGIANGYGLDDRGVRVQVSVGSRIFSPPHCPDQHWGPPTYPMGTWGLFPWR
jgi:hypothetical protein